MKWKIKWVSSFKCLFIFLILKLGSNGTLVITTAILSRPFFFSLYLCIMWPSKRAEQQICQWQETILEKLNLKNQNGIKLHRQVIR